MCCAFANGLPVRVVDERHLSTVTPTLLSRHCGQVRQPCPGATKCRVTVRTPALPSGDPARTHHPGRTPSNLRTARHARRTVRDGCRSCCASRRRSATEGDCLDGHDPTRRLLRATGLFDRAVRQFPPPGMDARRLISLRYEVPRPNRGARLYVGRHWHRARAKRPFSSARTQCATADAPPDCRGAAGGAVTRTGLWWDTSTACGC